MYRRNGELRQAIQDFDHAIAVDPNDAATYLERGFAEFELGQFEPAAADLMQSRHLYRYYLYTGLWLYLARGRNGRDGAAELKLFSDGFDLTVWPGPIVRFYLHRLDENGLRSAARSDDPTIRQDQNCEADFYVAEILVLDGERERAQLLFQKAGTECPVFFIEHDLAPAELKHLGP